MTTVNVTEQSNVSKYLIITQQKDPATLITTRVIITDNANNTIKLVDVQRGPEGPIGPVGPQGSPGKDGSTFDLLPIISGGTNNTTFLNDRIIYYDGNKLSSTNYTIDDIINLNGNKAITGIIEGSGISKQISGSSVVINTNLGEGLSLDPNNKIIVDDSIVRKIELNVGNISGILGINKGGTNNNIFNTNRLIYFDGNKLSSFPLDTGRIITSGSSISVVAGSGLIGGGSLSIPSGSVVLNVGPSQDIFVSENLIELSNTGIAGTYTKVITDIKGRVISGTSLSQIDVINALGFTPWHSANDGSGSNLDADLLDGHHGSYYLNFNNFTGTIQQEVLPTITSAGTYSKITINNKGLVLNGENINFNDIVGALGYRPVNSNGDTIIGDVDINGDVTLTNGKFKLEDNLPAFAQGNSNLLPNDPRGFSFVYGNVFKQTGILAYYPADNQLKLITQIFGSGTNDFGGGDSTDNFNGEIDGGDSNTIFLLGNMQGDQAIVLLQHIADQRYMRSITDQIIDGIKTFLKPIYVYDSINIIQSSDYLSPPINVGNNIGLNTNLNSDLLDSEHGAFYRNAYNLTGILDYNTVEVSNIDGVVDYISKFDNRTNNPSRTISKSIIKQSGSSNVIVENGSLSVGNNTISAIKSVAVGSNNNISSSNSLAIGTNNSVTSNNSIAINQGSSAKTPNSLAMGAYGTTWIPNQLSIGAFEEISPINNTTRIGLGQHSVAAIGYAGTAPSYINLSPSISIPDNKTVLYNIDLLFTKFGSNVAAAFSFQSGIIKNYTGVVTVIQNPKKYEIYNDSQLRDYIYTIQSNNNYKTQILSVKQQPLQNNNLSIQNLNNVYRIKPELSEISGYFWKTFDGNTILKMHKPVSSGEFVQTSGSPFIRIKCYEHNVVPNSLVNIKYTSGSLFTPLDSDYIASTYDMQKNEFFVFDSEWKASYDNGYIEIIYTNNPKFNSTYTYNRFSTSQSVFINDGIYALTSNRIGNITTTSSGIILQTDSSTPFLSEIKVYPTTSIENSGYVQVIRKRNYLGSYQRMDPDFKEYNCSYVQQPFFDGLGVIDLVSTDIQPISYLNNYNPYIKFLTATNTFSAILTSGSNILTGCNPPQNGLIFSGMKLHSNIPGFPSGNTVAFSPTDNTIEMLSPFTGTTTTGLIIYSGELPPAANYGIRSSGNFNLSVDRLDSTVTGFYITGMAKVYSNYGIATIKISGLKDANIQSGDMSYVDFLDKDSSIVGAIKPVSDNYLILDSSFEKMTIESYHLLPDSGVAITGSCYVTLDKDHGFLPPENKPKLLQQIPLIHSIPQNFAIGENIFTNPSNRKPKDGIFTIVGVTGDSIAINTYTTSLLRESGLSPEPPYYDALINSIYSIDNNNTLKIKFNKNYLELNDQIYCSFNDHPSYNQNFRITGIDSENSRYLATPVSGSILGTLPNTGNLSFIGSSSGFVRSPINNIYFNSYGGITESWGRDYTGKYVNPPKTGFFNIYNSSKLCNSGTFCVHISGSINDFNNINPGDTFYFDFIDLTGFNLKNIFTVYDKLSPNTLTLNIDRDPNYVDRFDDVDDNESGIVYLIDSSENIKTNKNPNYNNIFLTSNIGIGGDDIYQDKLSTFNDNNRWKHCLSIPNNISATGYSSTFTISVNGETSEAESDILIFNATNMEIILQHSIDGSPYSTISDSITVPVSSILKIKTIVKNGAGKWSNDNTSAPGVNIIGLSDYAEESKIYYANLKQWEIITSYSVSKEIIPYRDIKIIVTDESGRDTKNFKLYTTQPLKTTNIQNTIYGYADAPSIWELKFEVYGGNINSNNAPTIISNLSTASGFPTDANQYNVTEIISNDMNKWYSVKITGSPGSVPTTYNPFFTVSDGTNHLDTSGILPIRQNTSTEQQTYSLSPRKFQNDITIPYSQISQQSNFDFILPVLDDQEPLYVNWQNTSSLSINSLLSSFYPNFKLLSYRAIVSGQPGFYTPQLNMNISQPSGGGYAQYSLSTGINITIYNRIDISLSGLLEPIIFDSNKRWELNFYVINGGCAYRSGVAPKVYLGNVPGIGSFSTNSPFLEYDMSKQYNNTYKCWQISVTGKLSHFGEPTIGTGNYPIFVYVEDYTSWQTGVINTKVISSSYLKNIDTKKYATPNNGFEFNADVGGASYNSGIAPQLQLSDKDPLIVETNEDLYYLYDPTTKLWEKRQKCNPLLEKWDSQIVLSGKSLLIKAKGITDDKIYVAGKVSTVETDNLNTSLKPLTITNLKTPKIEFKQGSAWDLTFNTEGGLESAQYPPQIIFNEMPTPCSGFDPQSSPVPQCVVGQAPQWDNTEKSWKYTFRGTPTCIVGEFPIVIEARDKILNSQYGSTTAQTKIVYKTLGEQYPPTAGDLENKSMYPNCVSYKSNLVPYGPGIRETCPVPTGISGIITFGSLPPGIQFIDANLGSFKAPYNNLSSGNFYFEGYPTEFANGAAYPYKFSVTIFDGRGLSITLDDIQFNDASRPIATSPTDITIYFANSGYQYTPKKDSSTNPPTIYPSGTKIIDNIITPMLRPPAISESMQCFSILPHNNCMYSTGLYTIKDTNTIEITGPGTSDPILENSLRTINNNNKIYLEFDSQVGSFKGEYVAQRTNNSSINIIKNSHGINSNTSGLVKILKIQDNLKTNFSLNSIISNEYRGDPQTNIGPTNGIMGNGNLIQDNNIYGIAGRIRPAFKAGLASGIYAENSQHLENFSISELYTNANIDEIYKIKFTNCYETGYLRLSGIILPTFSLDSQDPPPGAGRYTAVGDGDIAVAIRPGYGITNTDRNKSENRRAISDIQCEVIDIMRDTVVQSGIVDATTDSNNIIVANFNISSTTFSQQNIGTIFKLYINYISNEIFPTYKRNAIPSASTEYYWVHKGDFAGASINSDSFPPVVPITKNSLYFTSGINNNNKISFIGGYIPTGSYSYSNYPPKITGYIQQNYSSFVVATGTYKQESFSSTLSIRIDNNPFNINDAVLLSFSSEIGPDLPALSTGLILDTVSQDYIDLSDIDTSALLRSGVVEVRDLVQIKAVQGSINNIEIICRSGLLNQLFTNDNIDLIKFNNTNNSLFKRSALTNTFPRDYSLKIISKTSTSMIASLNLSETDTTNYYDNLFESNGSGLCEIRKNIYNPDSSPIFRFSATPDLIDSIGQSTFALTGIPTITGNYNFAIITSENPDVTGLNNNIPIKKYLKDYDISIIRPLSIVASTPYVNFNAVTDTWAYSFDVVGGFVSRPNNPLEVEINNKIHTFTSGFIPTPYGATVNLVSNSYGLNYWSGIFAQQSFITLRVYDTTGSDSIQLYRVQE